ncbi:MAG: hypothetical protein LQ337_003399 [Flavoplaca oasis]|nr:MAG: hypothetical protein LQ337_003399 [Flavoplaca oasis]
MSAAHPEPTTKVKGITPSQPSDLWWIIVVGVLGGIFGALVVLAVCCQSRRARAPFTCVKSLVMGCWPSLRNPLLTLHNLATGYVIEEWIDGVELETWRLQTDGATDGDDDDAPAWDCETAVSSPQTSQPVDTSTTGLPSDSTDEDDIRPAPEETEEMRRKLSAERKENEDIVDKGTVQQANRHRSRYHQQTSGA